MKNLSTFLNERYESRPMLIIEFELEFEGSRTRV